MGKKRKGAGRKAEESDGPNLDVGGSRKRIRDFEDVADSDDEFHLNRDKVLLDEEPEAKRQRKWQEQEEFLEPSDEEVLDYSEEDEDDAVDYLQGAANGNAYDSEDAEDGADDYEDETGWGMSKGDIYGADDIETEEQALEEEKEALRLQKKQLQSMTAADYGFDESEWQDGGAEKNDKDSANVVTEVLPQLQVDKDMSVAERLKLLKTRYPEFEPLSKELLDLMEVHAKFVKQSRKKAAHASPDVYPNLITKLRACAAYVGALTIYFALLTSPAQSGQNEVLAMPAIQLRDHPVMDTLVKSRELWQRAKDLPEDPDPMPVIGSGSLTREANGVDDHNQLQRRPKKEKVAPKSRAERHAEAKEDAAQKQKAERLQKTEADLAELDNLLASSESSKLRKAKNSGPDQNATGTQFDEEAALTANEAAEKAKRKKSLRFYTSQIAQKANKRGAAGRNAGGDDDIPYRERLKDRQARLNAEAERRGQRRADVGHDLGGASDEDDDRQARDIQGEQDNEYYDLIASKTARKKADKAAFAEAQKQAALQGGQVIPEETVGPDGKRKITYAIEKNKGLTPHRKKDVRNPRVKKRKKFDEKKKKLGSVKAVYKGGEGKGGYGGELTGIKKGLVKSTKL